MLWIVDIQGFAYANEMEFMCKEITLINTYNGFYMHKIINFPLDVCAFSDKVKGHTEWVTDNIHGLEWNMKTNNHLCLNYEDLTSFLKQYITVDDEVAVKGVCKKKWLSHLISNEITDLTDKGCPPLHELKTIFRSYHCNNHNKNNLNCALENIFFLYNWYVYCLKK